MSKRKKKSIKKKKTYSMIHLEHEIFIEADAKTLYKYFYRMDLFQKWFNSWVVTFSANSEFLAPGIDVYAKFRLIIYFKMKVVSLKEMEFVNVDVAGCMNGFVKFLFIKKKNGYIFRHIMGLRGSNLFYQLAYKFIFIIGHNLYMPYVFDKLKRMAEADYRSIHENNE